MTFRIVDPDTGEVIVNRDEVPTDETWARVATLFEIAFDELYTVQVGPMTYVEYSDGANKYRVVYAQGDDVPVSVQKVGQLDVLFREVGSG